MKPENEQTGLLPELLRRGLSLGVAGFLMTEEALRKALGDNMPKDALEYVVAQSEAMRAEFLDRIGKEFGRAVGALDPVEVASRLLEGRTLEVTARFRLLPKEDDAEDDAEADG